VASSCRSRARSASRLKAAKSSWATTGRPPDPGHGGWQAGRGRAQDSQGPSFPHLGSGGGGHVVCSPRPSGGRAAVLGRRLHRLWPGHYHRGRPAISPGDAFGPVRSPGQASWAAADPTPRPPALGRVDLVGPRCPTPRWSARCWATPPSRLPWTPTATSFRRSSRKRRVSLPPPSSILPQRCLKRPRRGRSGSSRGEWCSKAAVVAE
jgi:hypothetical protein